MEMERILTSRKNSSHGGESGFVCPALFELQRPLLPESMGALEDLFGQEPALEDFLEVGKSQCPPHMEAVRHHLWRPHHRDPDPEILSWHIRLQADALAVLSGDLFTLSLLENLVPLVTDQDTTLDARHEARPTDKQHLKGRLRRGAHPDSVELPLARSHGKVLQDLSQSLWLFARPPPDGIDLSLSTLRPTRRQKRSGLLGQASPRERGIFPKLLNGP